MTTSKKVSELTALTTPKAGDLLLIVDGPATAEPTSKNITVQNLFKNVTSNTITTTSLVSQNVSAVNVAANGSIVVGSVNNNTQIGATQIKVGSSLTNSIVNSTSITTSQLISNSVNVNSLFTLGNTVAINSVAIAISNNGTATYISAAQAQFGANVEISGQLIVSGLATYLDTDELNISDPLIVLNYEIPPNIAPTTNAGITINRGSSANVSLIWNETTDKWQLTHANGVFANIAIEGIGSANTGDITFSGVQIIGSGSNSGDGNGYSTLDLVPDANLVSTNQYLIIDPTAPSHIHIRAGGEQDASQAQLYLGGERNYARVVDNSGVRIQNQRDQDAFYYYADPSDFTSATWYEESGNYFVELTTSNTALVGHGFDFTNNTDLNELTVYYGDAESNTLTSSGSASNLGGGVYRVGVNEAPPSSPTSLTALEFRLFTTQTNYVRLENSDFEVSAEEDVRISSSSTFRLINYAPNQPIEIVTDYDDQEYSFKFNPTGSFEFPQGGIIRVTSTIPTSSIGSSDDKAGTIAFSNTYFYYCTADYDGVANIWKRIQWSGDTW